RGEGSTFDRLCHLIQSVMIQDEKVEKIIVAAPGPVNPITGVVSSAPNIPEWTDFPLGPNLSKHFSLPVKVGNDANLAALGEWRFGAGKGHNHLIYMTISTGIGGGVITDGKLLLGANGLAAELGHTTIQPDGPLCSCGQYGHIESFTSGPSIARYVQEKIAQGAESTLKNTPSITAKEITSAAADGDKLALDALNRAGTYLGMMLASFVQIFNPSIVIFGGGVSLSGKFLFDPMQESLKKHVMDPAYIRDLKIAAASLSDNAGLMGALALGLLPDN
ncbi:MAG: ROK family protein, partial [Chloroflexota bacterium]